MREPRGADGWALHALDFWELSDRVPKLAHLRVAIDQRVAPFLEGVDAHLVEELSDLGIPILSDEIYDGLTYDGARVTSPLCFTEDCYVLDGFSKRYAMTGFRLGYLIAPKMAMRPLQSLMQSFFISTSQFVQQAGIAALAHGAEHVEHMRQ